MPPINTSHRIKSVKAREILDSRGNPTVEVEITLTDGSLGRAGVPSGASTGTHEAVELRDGGKRYGGKGVKKAVKNVSLIAKKLIGKSWSQASLDTMMIELDGTAQKSKLGANAILGVSLAFLKASAVSSQMALWKFVAKQYKTKPSLPVPLLNILNGGAHAKGSTDIQEYMIVPHGAPNFAEGLRYSAEVFHALKKLLTDRDLATNVGDEGGFAPKLSSNEEAIKIILEAVTQAGYKAGIDISLALDVAATELYKNDRYILASENKIMTTSELIEMYANWIKKYPIVSIEDGLAEDDWVGWHDMTQILGKKIQIVGDDLFVTNKARLARGIAEHCANSILIKLNQIGTVSETVETVILAKKSGFTAIISHRSGETEDTAIADLAVGLGTGQIKTGSTSRGERIAKYNQLLRIEEALGKKTNYVK